MSEEINGEFLKGIPAEYWLICAGMFASDLYTDYKMYVEFFNKKELK